MKTYEYRGFDPQGRVSKGLIEALSTKNAREKLADKGILAEHVSDTGRSLRFSAEMRAFFYRELSTLLSAGIPLVRSLDILINSPEMIASGTLLASVKDRITEGSSLANALCKASGSITAFERTIIEVAERSANVEVMLERLASFLEEQDKLKGRVQRALIYPLIVVAFGICVAILMLSLLMPMVRELLSQKGTSLPALTVFMIGSGRFMLRWGLLIIAALAAGVFYIRYKLQYDLGFKQVWSRLIFRLPVFGKGLNILVSLRFARTLAILLHGGVSIIEGLILAGRATGNAWIELLAEKESGLIRHGSSLSEAVKRIPPLAGSLPGMIQVGEASGEMEKILDNAGNRYQYHWDRYIETCLSFMEPVLIFIIGAFVLAVTLSVLLPVLSLSQIAGK